MDELDSKSVSANVRRAPTQLRHQDADQEQESATYGLTSCHCIQTPTGLLLVSNRAFTAVAAAVYSDRLKLERGASINRGGGHSI
jgi:hypothetical protein